MMDNEKKRFYLIVGLIFVFLIVAAIVATYLNNSNKINSSINGSNLVKIVGPNIKFAKITTDGKYIYYFSNEDSKFYRYQISNQEKTVLSVKVDSPTDVIWSPKFDKAILKVTYQTTFENSGSPFADAKNQDGNPTNWFIDFSSKQISELDPNIQELDWSPNNNQIVYNFASASTNAISMSNANGQNYQKLFDLDPTIYSIGAGVKFLSDQKILYYPIVDEINGGNVIIYDLQTKKYQNIVDDNSASVIIPSPDKKKIFCNIYSNGTTTPMIIDLTSRQKTKIETTDLLYVAWTADGQSILGMGTKNKNYSILKIDLDGKVKKTYINSVVNIEQIFAPTDGSGIYIASDNSIYKLKSSKK